MFSLCLISIQIHQNFDLSAQNALIEAKNRAEEAVTAKSVFLANMSHEIRTPLCGIITLTQLLADDDLTPSQKVLNIKEQSSSVCPNKLTIQDLVRTVSASGAILLGIVNDILDFSKLEATKVTLKHLVYNLETCIEGVCDVLVRGWRPFKPNLTAFKFRQCKRKIRVSN